MTSESSVSAVRLGVTLALALGWTVTSGCADLSRGDSPGAGDGGNTSQDGAPSDGGLDPDAPVSFAVTVHPLLRSGCESCHRQGGEAGDTSLVLGGDAAADYATAHPLVDAAAPTASRLLAKMAGHGHSGGAVYSESTPEYATTLRWIAGGALP